MKNWKYIDGAKNGNSLSDKLKTIGRDKIVLTSPNGGKIILHKDGDAFVSEKGQIQTILEKNPSFEAALEKYKSKGYKIGNEKACNALKYTSLEEAKKMCRQMNDSLAPDAALRHYRHVYEKDGAYYVMETGEATAKGMKRVGNEKTGAEGFFKQLSDDVKEREKKDDKEIEEVGNRIDWSENLVGKNVWVKDKGEEWKVYVLQDKGDKVYIRDEEDGTQGWVSKKRITGKVGNSDPKEEYWKRQYIEAARKKGISEKEIQEFIKKIEKEGAKGVLIPVKNIASEYEILKQDPSKMHPLYKKAYEEALKKLSREDEDFKKRFEKEYGVKAKNEASDDKFAYVMREFDEGKLKTPDGKVVTDPAQAKAIAYSESKKTENGLARARNAIKKS